MSHRAAEPKQRDDLDPRAGHVYVVRWIRADGYEIRQKFYRREHDAVRLADALRRYGKTVQVYRAGVEWHATSSTSTDNGAGRGPVRSKPDAARTVRDGPRPDPSRSGLDDGADR